MPPDMPAGTRAETFDETFDCYVINLARTPERMAAFLQRNGSTGIRFRRFEAVDGNALTNEEALERGVIAPKSKWATKGTIGVALSHRNLWDKAVADGRSLIVLEDDAYARHDLKAAFMQAIAAVGRWDIVLLGYNTDSLLEFAVAGDIAISGLFTVRYPKPAELDKFQQTRGSVGLFRLKHAFGICGYAVSPEGAARLSQAVFPMDNRMLEFPATNMRFPAYSVDGLMAVTYPAIEAYACIAPLVLAPNDKARSTVMTSVGPGVRRR